MTLMSMFKAGDVFAAGAAGAPVTEWRLYDTHYTERYMGDPRVDGDAYDASSVFPYADGLQGPLLVVHGMADDNVLFSHSTRLYRHLQEMGKPFEVMDYPGEKHGISSSKSIRVHYAQTVMDFFNRHLKD
jgi:dipeptidyl-peptidase-4